MKIRRRIMFSLLVAAILSLACGCAKKASDGTVPTTAQETTGTTTTKAPETTTEVKKEMTVDEVLDQMQKNLAEYPYLSGTYLLNVNETKGDTLSETVLDSEFEVSKTGPVVHTTGQLTEEEKTVGLETFVCKADEAEKVKVMKLREDAWSQKTEEAEKVQPKSSEDFLSLLTMPAFTAVSEQTEEGKTSLLLAGSMTPAKLADFFARLGVFEELKNAPELKDVGADVTLTVNPETLLPEDLRVVAETGKDDEKVTINSAVSFLIFDKSKTVTVPEEDIAKAIEAQKKAKEDERTPVWVEVDLTKQYVYLHKDGEVIASSPCVTGCVADGNGTPTGTFHIAYKQKDRTLRGTNRDGTKYESFVKYWISFNGSIGLHDASWRSNFSAKRAWNNGSHGCVNLPTKFAGTLYNAVSAGDVVYVHGWPVGSHVHTTGDWVIDTEPTCKTEGKKLLKCTSCGKAVKYQMIPIDKDAHVWDKGTVTKEATTTEEGSILYTCTLCGTTKTETIPKKEETTTSSRIRSGYNRT